MPHHYDKGLSRLLVQAAEQPSPNHRSYVVPVRGMNTMVQEKYLHPEEGYAPLIKNFLPTLRGTLQKRKGIKRPKTPLRSQSARAKYPVEFFEFGDFKGRNHLIYLTHNKDLRRLTMTSATDVKENSWQDAADIGGDAEAVNVFFGVIGGAGKTFIFFTSDSFDNPISKAEILEDGSDPVSDSGHEGFHGLNARVLFSYKSVLILANTQEQITESDTKEQRPYRFRWSNPNQPENFKDLLEADQGGYIDLLEDEQKGPILNCIPFRGNIAVYKPNSIYTLAQRSDGQFISEMKISDKGLLAPKAVAPVKNGSLHFVVSHDNVYLFDGFDMKYPPIGEKIRRYFYDRLDWNKINTMYCKAFPTRNECWIFYDAEGGARESLCWNWERNSWTWHDLPIRCAWWTTQLTFGDTQTSEPKFFGSSMKTGKTGIVEMFNSFTDLNDAITGEIRFPLVAKSAGSQADQKQIQHLFSGTIYLEATIPDLNDLDNYTLYLRHSDNPLLAVEQTEVLKPAPRSPVGDSIPWRENDRIQFNVGDWKPSDYNSNEEVTPAFYTGISLTAESKIASEEVSVLEVEGIGEGSQFTP